MLLLPAFLNRYFPRRLITALSAEETLRFEQEDNEQINDLEVITN